MSVSIPSVDLELFSSNPKQFVETLGYGFSEYGFCGIKNHNIDTSIIDDAYDVSKQFFDLPDDVKKRYVLPNSGGARGYTGFGIEKAKDAQHVDLKEYWHVGRELPNQHPLSAYMPSNFTVAEVSNFNTALNRLFTALDNLSLTVLKGIALYLHQDEEFFADKVNHGNSILRAIHYPPIQDASTKSVRAAAHEDINVITLLVGSNEPGLEILSKSGEWIPVTTIEGTIVCNIGDMLQRLTNHVLRSTTHRVVNPPSLKLDEARYSIPYFMHFNPDYVIETLASCITPDNPDQYPKPIKTNDYLTERLREINVL